MADPLTVEDRFFLRIALKNRLLNQAQAETAAQAGLWSLDRGGDGRPVLLNPPPHTPDAAATQAAVRAGAPAMKPGAGQALMVIGGDTLSAMLAAVGAVSLDCLGEVGAGLPLSRIHGGDFDGVEVITKSGGFGGPRLLIELVEAGRKAETAEA